ALQQDVRVILRLFDGDFADRVQRAFGVTISRSVSYLAAPAFAAAMLEREVIGTIAVSRHVLRRAEVLVCAGSALDGAPLSAANEVGQARVIALNAERGTAWLPAERVLAADDRLTVVGTRAGLGRLLTRSGTPRPGEEVPA